MLHSLKTFSLHRSSWLLLAFSGLALECTALYFQHQMGLTPCVMCIYERVALGVIIIAGFLGVIAPKISIIRWLALGIALFGAGKGLALAIEHTRYQLYPSPFNQCPIKVDFPSTLPLNEWFPSIFEAGGLCSKIQWQFLGYSMPQWLIFAFACYLVALTVVFFSQFTKLKPQYRLFR